LHAVWGPLAGMLGQLPAVLASHVAEQTAQVGQRPSARLGAREPARDAGVQGVQPGRPRLTSSMSAASASSTAPSSMVLWAADPSPAGGREPTPSTKASAAGVLGRNPGLRQVAVCTNWLNMVVAGIWLPAWTDAVAWSRATTYVGASGTA
jgi:hypothetical protein